MAVLKKDGQQVLYGSALAVVRSESVGEITIIVSGDGLEPAVAKVTVIE